MQSDNKLFEDISKMATGAAGTLLEMKREIEAMVKSQAEAILSRMDLVTREEFEVVRGMAEKARAEQLILQEKVVELEKSLASASAKKKSSK